MDSPPHTLETGETGARSMRIFSALGGGYLAVGGISDTSDTSLYIYRT